MFVATLALWLLPVWLLLQPSLVFSKQAPVVTPSADTISWIADPLSALDIKQVRGKSGEWQPGAAGTRTPMTATGQYWFRWNLPSLADRGEEHWVSLGHGPWQEADIWFLDQRGRILSQRKTGLSIPISERQIAHPQQLISFKAPRRDKLTLIFRLRSVAPATFQPQIWKPAQFIAADRLTRDRLALTTGALLAFALLAVGMSLWTRDAVFKAQAPLALCIALACLNWHGYLPFWIWPERAALNLYGSAVAISLIATFIAILGQRVPDTSNRMTHRALGITQRLVWMGSLAVIATASLIPANASLIASTVLLTLALVLTGCACVFRRISGEKDGATLLIGTLVFLATVAITGLLQIGQTPIWWPAWATPMDATATGSLIAFLFMLVGAAQRQTSQQRLHSLAQADWLESHRAATNRLEETVKARTFELQTAHDQLSRMSRIDGLTGVYNRRYFDESLQAEIERSGRSNEPIGIVMIDLDHFKKLNDEHGHAAGDACLKEASRLAKQCVDHDSDMIARYGGEEFVALLVNASRDRACEFAERVRSTIEAHEVHYEDKVLRMTASLGVYCDRASERSDEERLLKVADEALYDAKRSGRNRVHYAGDQIAETPSAEATGEQEESAEETEPALASEQT
ncbi:MAG: diguanylate cyclase [Burkholderiaceae bacterium]